MTEIKETYQFNSDSRGTISLQNKSGNKNKLSFTPSPKVDDSNRIYFDMKIEPFDSILNENTNSKTSMKLGKPAEEKKTGEIKTEKSHSVHINPKRLPENSMYPNGQLDLFKAKSKDEQNKSDNNFLEYFNENYEDLISTIQNNRKSGSFHISESLFGKSQPKSTQSASTKVSFFPVVNSSSSGEPVSDLISQASKNAEEIKGLTNTEEISNFYEYTEECMKRIIQLKVTPNEEIEHLLITLPCEREVITGKKRLAIFDLDETLVHCNVKDTKKSDHVIPITLPSGGRAKVGLNVRPFWKEALIEIKKNYSIIVYTASHQSYADSVIDFLDPNHELIEHRLYRHNCVKVQMDTGDSIYVKDLRIFKNISLKDMIIIDNSIMSFAFQLENGIPIMPYYDNKNDTELKFLAYFLNAIASSSDLRIENKKNMRLDYFLEKARKDEICETSSSINVDSSVQEDDSSLVLEITNKSEDNCKSQSADLISLTMCNNTDDSREESSIHENPLNITNPKLPGVAKRMSVFQGELLNTFNVMKQNFKDYIKK